MKVHIYSNRPSPFGGMAFQEKDLDRGELLQLRQSVHKKITEWFKWSDYQGWLRHLVYYVELDGEAYVYEEGYIMGEDEFEEKIANRKGVAFAGVMHRR